MAMTKLQKGIPEHDITKFDQMVDEYCIGPVYRMSCLLLFEKNEVSFSDEHMIML